MQAAASTTCRHGGSRASKKRAKKKKKQQVPQQQPQLLAGVNDNDDADEHAAVKKKPRVEGSQQDRAASKKTKKDRHDDNSKGSGPSSSISVPDAEKKNNKNKVPAESILHFLHPENSSVPLSIQETLGNMTAKERARAALAFLLFPADNIAVEEFHDEYWEKKPLLVQASSSGHRHRLDGLLSLESIRQMLHDHPMAYGRDLNVTKYTVDPATGQQRRLTLDRMPETVQDEHDDDNNNDNKQMEYIEARPGEVWKHFREGCTIRLLCPHQYVDSVQAFLSLLEVEWGCMVGANAYLTPPDASQGFAPHYDDIEAFCLQLSGRKRWKVYPPFAGEKLPRVSSPDYTEEDLQDVEPVLDVVLSPGDMLYMPRGWIHQACTLQGVATKNNHDGHSLHLTVSAMQHWAWADLLEVLLPEALAAAANSESSTALREGLPRNFLDYMGAVHDDSKESEVLSKVQNDNDAVQDPDKKSAQEHFRAEAKNRIMRVAKEAMDMLDGACDQMGKQYITSCQPPAFTTKEKKMTSLSETKAVKILPDMLVRLARPGIARLVLEDGKAVLYHCMDNSRVYHEKPIIPMEFETDDAPAIEQVLTTVEPHWICVADLYHDTVEDKVGVVQALYDEGILALRH